MKYKHCLFVHKRNNQFWGAVWHYAKSAVYLKKTIFYLANLFIKKKGIWGMGS